MEFVIAAAWSVWAAFGQVGRVLRNFPWHYVIDIGIMTFIVYQAYLRFRGTRAIRVLEGVAILGVGGVVAQRAGLFLTSWLLGAISATALVFVIVIFQGEIRQMLEQVNPGPSRRTLLHWAKQMGLPQASLVTIAEAVFALASKRYGALLMFERRDLLESFLGSPGTVVDAQASPELLENLLTPATPLHDGALYIRAGRIYRAGCVLPLSENRLLASFYGTRHRAALGISEQSDALAVVVSEERGTVSVAEKSTLEVVGTSAELLTWLTDRLTAASEKPQRRGLNIALVTYNWRPKLAALAVVGLLWFVLVGKQDTVVGFSVPLVYTNVPKGLTIQDQQVEEVYVRVQGAQEMFNFLDPSRLRVVLDLKEAKAGSQRYNISSKSINLPPSLQLIEASPSEISLRLREQPATPNGGQR